METVEGAQRILGIKDKVFHSLQASFQDLHFSLDDLRNIGVVISLWNIEGTESFRFPVMATSQLKWMLAAMVMTFLFSSQLAESSRLLSDEIAALDRSGRSLLQTCWPGMRLNCDANTQVECEVGGVGGCSCLAMEACLPEVSGCFVVVNGIATTSCGF